MQHKHTRNTDFRHHTFIQKRNTKSKARETVGINNEGESVGNGSESQCSEEEERKKDMPDKKLKSTNRFTITFSNNYYNAW